MEKRHCSNTNGVYQPGQHGISVMHQSYQQVQPQFAQEVSQLQQVYQPIYISNQIANMTPYQSGDYNNQMNTAQWLQSNIGATIQTYQTHQTFQQNYLPDSTAVPSHYK